jgi:hypothetical protein
MRRGVLAFSFYRGGGQFSIAMVIYAVNAIENYQNWDCIRNKVFLRKQTKQCGDIYLQMITENKTLLALGIKPMAPSLN